MLIANISFSYRTTGEKDMKIMAIGGNALEFDLPVIGEIEGIFADYDKIVVHFFGGEKITIDETYECTYRKPTGLCLSQNLKYHHCTLRETLKGFEI